MVFTSMGVTAMMLGRRPSDPVSRALTGLVAAGCMLPCRILLPRLYKSANAPLEEREVLHKVLRGQTRLQQTKQQQQKKQQQQQLPKQLQLQQKQQQQAPQRGRAPSCSSSGHDDSSRPGKRSTTRTSIVGTSAAVVPEGGSLKVEEVRGPLGAVDPHHQSQAASGRSADPQASGVTLAVPSRRLRIQHVVRVRAKRRMVYSPAKLE